jgi:hypothetical protein
VLRAVLTTGRRSDIEEECPIRLSMAVEGTLRDVEPRGRERIERRWFAYWLDSQASMV